MTCVNGPLARYVKLRVAHAPGMPGTFSPPPQVSDPGMHHGTCVMHVPWCMPGSLTSGFLWSRWRVKRSRHSQRMRNSQDYVSGKRPIAYANELVKGLVVFSGCINWKLRWGDTPENILHAKIDYVHYAITRGQPKLGMSFTLLCIAPLLPHKEKICETKLLGMLPCLTNSMNMSNLYFC